MELQQKIVLKKKNETHSLSPASLAGAIITLIWTSLLDLDVMMFFKKKDGTLGGVFSDEYPGGDLHGSFAEHSGDAGVECEAGEKSETITLKQIPDDIEQIDVMCLDYTAASEGRKTSFSELMAKISIQAPGQQPIEIHMDPDSEKQSDEGIGLGILRITRKADGNLEMKNHSVHYHTLQEIVKDVPGFEALIK